MAKRPIAAFLSPVYKGGAAYWIAWAPQRVEGTRCTKWTKNNHKYVQTEDRLSCSSYESRSLESFYGSERSVFWSRIDLTACRTTEISRSKPFKKKERRKPFYVLDVERISVFNNELTIHRDNTYMNVMHEIFKEQYTKNNSKCKFRQARDDQLNS